MEHSANSISSSLSAMTLASAEGSTRATAKFRKNSTKESFQSPKRRLPARKRYDDLTYKRRLRYYHNRYDKPSHQQMIRLLSYEFTFEITKNTLKKDLKHFGLKRNDSSNQASQKASVEQAGASEDEHDAEASNLPRDIQTAYLPEASSILQVFPEEEFMAIQGLGNFNEDLSRATVSSTTDALGEKYKENEGELNPSDKPAKHLLLGASTFLRGGGGEATLLTDLNQVTCSSTNEADVIMEDTFLGPWEQFPGHTYTDTELCSETSEVFFLMDQVKESYGG